MNIQSSFQKDIRRPKSTPGAYEWWYFDALSNDGETELVVIFYEGNPFSRRYIDQLRDGGAAKAADFPAISISVYRHHKPVYYSFTEVKKEQACFGSKSPAVQIAAHKMTGRQEESKNIYALDLQEELPSGDAIEAHLKFVSPAKSHPFFKHFEQPNSNHAWHVPQPRAGVTGSIRCKARREKPRNINFKGQGYHDHNIGSEPLNLHFDDWYWGRFHFEDLTLIYYLTDSGEQNGYGWLLDNRQQHVIQHFEDIQLQDKSRTFYGLHTARKIILANSETELFIQQTHPLDNGPFYQRFSSNAFLSMPGQNDLQKSRGITEYLSPQRMYKRRYWPLTNMRIRYKKESPHWVQRSKTLYRWTW